MGRNYARGAARERQAGVLLEAEGWSVTRSAGSRSPHDLVACRKGDVVRYVQVKSTARGPFAGFPPSERKELLAEAERAGAEPWLLWWPGDRKGPRWIGADDWPPGPV
jgi:Holliday junction resolvase